MTSATGPDAARPPDVAQVVRAACARLRAEYVVPDVGRAAADHLETAWQRGELDGCDGPAVAAQLTALLRVLADDGHFAVKYHEVVASQPAGISPEYEARETERFYGAHINHGFRKAERREPNIGLLALDVFAPVRLGGDTAVAAMQFLAATEALIVDLRHNSGGYGEMVTLLSSYLFDAGGAPLSAVYTRPTDETVQERCLDYVPGRRYGEHKPVFVLTSGQTFSAAEAFAYDLRALGRVTVIGEPSGGGGHPFEYRHLTENFTLWLPVSRSINPITGGNWQGSGVPVDVPVPADEALGVALAMAGDAVRSGRSGSRAGPAHDAESRGGSEHGDRPVAVGAFHQGTETP